MSVFKKLFDELENQCAELEKRMQMELAVDSDIRDENYTEANTRTAINKLCSAVVAKTEELCPSLLSKARKISVKFEQAFKLFAGYNFVYDSAEYLDDEKIDKLGR